MQRVPFDELDLSSDSNLLTYKGEPFTGIAYELGPNGELVSEVSYVEGQKSGLSKDWSSRGHLLREQSYIFDSLHGLSREWHDDESPKRESHYELGICTREREWRQNGELVRDFVLGEENPQFVTLQKLRASTIGRLAGRNS